MTTEPSVGAFLKQKREGQGLSLDQVASLTRIQSKFLHALEEETFADLPEQVFTRGFVRTYARSLGINEEDALRRFSEASSEFYERGIQEQQQVSLKIQEERQGKLNRNLVIGITVVILIALGLFLPRQQQTPTPSASQETTGAPLSPSAFHRRRRRGPIDKQGKKLRRHKKALPKKMSFRNHPRQFPRNRKP